MNINRSHVRIAAFSIAIALLLQIAPVLAERPSEGGNRPVTVTFTKWVTGPVYVPDYFGITEGRGLMAGYTRGDIPGKFVGEVLLVDEGNELVEGGWVAVAPRQQQGGGTIDHVTSRSLSRSRRPSRS